MAISKETAQRHLDAWLEAELTVTSGQSYTLTTSNGGRTLTRANLTEIRNAITYWEGKVKQATNIESGKARNRAYRIVPRDV